MTQASTDISSADDPELFELPVGALVNLKGKLEAVRYGDGHGRTRSPITKGGEVQSPMERKSSLVITFADWGMLSVSIQTEEIARSIRIPLGTYVCVKARIVNEDNELEAIAIWELGNNPVPIPLIDSVDTPQRTTVSCPSNHWNDGTDVCADCGANLQ